jgi:hypothetical protein
MFVNALEINSRQKPRVVRPNDAHKACHRRYERNLLDLRREMILSWEKIS